MGLNTGRRTPRSGQLFEVQFHAPASKHAQEVTHLLYGKQRLPSTTPGRKKGLQARQDAAFAAVPVPPVADQLSAPRQTAPPPLPVPVLGRGSLADSAPMSSAFVPRRGTDRGVR